MKKITIALLTMFLSVSAFAHNSLRSASNAQLIAELKSRLGVVEAKFTLEASCNFNMLNLTIMDKNYNEVDKKMLSFMGQDACTNVETYVTRNMKKITQNFRLATCMGPTLYTTAILMNGSFKQIGSPQFLNSSSNCLKRAALINNSNFQRQ